MYTVCGRLKDNRVATDQCSRYHKDGTSLIIRDVAEEDAGNYTILVGIQQHNLYQNLTFTLVVNGESQQSNCSVRLSSDRLLSLQLLNIDFATLCLILESQWALRLGRKQCRCKTPAPCLGGAEKSFTARPTASRCRTFSGSGTAAQLKACK